MSYQFVFRHEAFLDIKDATLWYEQQKLGLGNEFFLAVQLAFENILQNPLLFRTLEKNVRRAFLSRFPYQIYYFIDNRDIVILGVLHSSRNHSKLIRRRK